MSMTIEQFAKNLAAEFRRQFNDHSAKCVECALAASAEPQPAPAKPLIAAWNGREFKLEPGQKWNNHDGEGWLDVLFDKAVAVWKPSGIACEYSWDEVKHLIATDHELRPCDANGKRVPEWIAVKEGERWLNKRGNLVYLTIGGFAFYESCTNGLPSRSDAYANAVALEDDINANPSDWKRLDPPQADEPKPMTAEPKPMTAGERAVHATDLVEGLEVLPWYAMQIYGRTAKLIDKVVGEECAKAAAEAVKAERERIADYAGRHGATSIAQSIRQGAVAK